MKYIILSTILSVNAFFFGSMVLDKVYPVVHTQREWVMQINGLGEVQNYLRTIDLGSPREAFTCDSILQSHINDINRQVYAAMQADTLQSKKGKP